MHMEINGYEYDPFVYRKFTKTKKILRFIPHSVVEIEKLVEVETNILSATRKIIVTVSDVFVSPIAKEEITKFVGSHKELRVEKIVFIENFSASH